MAWFTNIGNNNNINNSVIMSSGSGKTIINGVEYDLPPGASICTKNGKVYINNVEVAGKHVEQCAEIKIEIHGDVNSANVSNSLTINGNINDADAGNSITVHGDIKGNADAGNNIMANKIYGKCDAGNNIMHG